MPVTFLALWGNGKRITDPAQADASIVVVRPWGFEIRADYTDGKQIYNEVLTFEKEPDVKQIEQSTLDRRAILEKRIAPMTKAEILVQLQSELAMAQNEINTAVAKVSELTSKIAAEVDPKPKGEAIKQ